MPFQSRMFSNLTRNPTSDAGFKAIFRKKENILALPLEKFILEELLEARKDDELDKLSALADVVMRAEQASAQATSIALATNHVLHRLVAAKKTMPSSHELVEMFGVEMQKAIEILGEAAANSNM